jgi:hypothetical protein
MKSTRFSNHRRILPIAVAILALLPLACGGPASQPTQTPAAQVTAAPAVKATSVPTAAPTALPTKPAVSQPTAVGVAATPTAKPSGLAGALGQFASPDSLNSYRSKMTMGEVKADGSKVPLTSWTMEWTKEGPSTHLIMGEGASAFETIEIGSKSWMKLMGGWIESSASPTETQSTQDTSNPDSFLPQQDITVKQVGTETVNGVPCKKYTYTGKVTIDLSEPGKPANKVTWEMTGEMWVADRIGLPPVAVKQTAQWKGSLLAGLLGAPTPGAASEVISYMEMELSDLNVAISIKAPEGAGQLPGIPTVPAGIPGLATPTARLTPGAVATKPSGAATPTPQASLELCWDYVPDPSNADTADAATQRMATALAMAAAPGQSTVIQSYVTEDELADVKAYYADWLPAWDWAQTGTGMLAPGGWDTSWKQAEYALRILLLAPTQAGATTTIIVICSFAK